MEGVSEWDRVKRKVSASREHWNDLCNKQQLALCTVVCHRGGFILTTRRRGTVTTNCNKRQQPVSVDKNSSTIISHTQWHANNEMIDFETVKNDCKVNASNNNARSYWHKLTFTWHMFTTNAQCSTMRIQQRLLLICHTIYSSQWQHAVRKNVRTYR